jgi:chromosome segregation and condensation protein ScpB
MKRITKELTEEILQKLKEREKLIKSRDMDIEKFSKMGDEVLKQLNEYYGDTGLAQRTFTRLSAKAFEFVFGIKR